MASENRYSRTSSASSYLSDYPRNSRAYLTPESEHLYSHLENRAPPTGRRRLCVCQGKAARKSLAITYVVISSVALAISGFLLARTFLWNQNQNQSQMEPCAPCTSLLTTPFLDEDPDVRTLTRQFRNGKEICCANTPEQFVTLVNKIFDRRNEEMKVEAQRQKESRSSDRRSNRKIIAAALQLSDSSHTQSRRWLTLNNGPLSYLDGIHLINNRLIIEHGGLYYVYSQVSFKIVMANGDALPEELDHGVHRYNVVLPNNGRQTLLQTAHTCTMSSNKAVYLHTSYVGGIILLNPRDEIFVTVSNSSFIDLDPKVSFVGAFKLGR
ncbi:tumor necrosis factor ligand superfamily member 10-like [Gigantopelta aegis]|uniref:tumor necrosis factor ligand superfamily member 10-like n=1 Tax=Gigantopelta aegis TaxID=1735272 RepID=UPI001B887790|nr:tumor necrosis factor ligand superfamily member 10-like [Gigantopelta aegis]XP_041358435.1 tumor necrosis factor ligand superfamily member 10-like [Gigantopelta aegis]